VEQQEELQSLSNLTPTLHRRSSKTTASGVPCLDSVATEIIEFFVHTTQVIGLPKSLGEIYGLLFASDRPINFDDVKTQLNLSKGATSQGLKQLRNIGAVKLTYIPGDRRDYYHAETELKKLVAGFLREQVTPQMAGWDMRLTRLNDMLSDEDNERNPLLDQRIEKLNSWASKLRRVVPVLMSVISP